MGRKNPMFDPAWGWFLAGWIVATARQASIDEAIAEHVFIDWLTVHQDGELDTGFLPLVGKDLKVTYDVASQEKTFELVTRKKVEGSHETGLYVRSDGTKFEVFGNPSSFSRPENLYGYTDINDCMELYSEILNSYDLPSFHLYGVKRFDNEHYHHTGSTIRTNEPVITRIDLTMNLETPDPYLYLRALSGYVHQGQIGHLYPDGATVDWNGKYNSKGEGGSGYVYIKYYIKYIDLAKKIDALDKLFRKSTDIEELKHYQERRQYLVSVHDYCKEHNIVRLEVSLKSKYLNKHGLQTVQAWNLETMTNVIYPYQFHKRLKTENNQILSTVERLIELGVKETLAKQADTIMNAWIQGKEFHYGKPGGLKRDSFYRYRKILLLVGCDISVRCDVMHIPVQTIKMKAEPIAPPTWYQMPLNTQERQNSELNYVPLTLVA
jgi:II/X family phage/plasmid replication protein